MNEEFCRRIGVDLAWEQRCLHKHSAWQVGESENRDGVTGAHAKEPRLREKPSWMGPSG